MDEVVSTDCLALPQCEQVSKRTNRNLTKDERCVVYEALLLRVRSSSKRRDGLVRGALKEVALQFKVTRETISSIWHQARESIARGDIIANVSTRKPGNVGRKKKIVDPDFLRSVPLMHRKTLRSVAASLHMSTTFVHMRLKEGDIMRHSNALKPYLTDANRNERVRFCLSMLDGVGSTTFQDCMNLIHIDEKWFYITEINARFYLAPDETPPLRTAKSKRFISKIMFLAAIARPRHDSHLDAPFDGKLGIFPFAFKEEAKRSSKNRARGTLETKCIENVNKEEIVKMLIEKVLPAVRQRWPRAWSGMGSDAATNIVLQLDNARPHPTGTETELALALAAGGFQMRLMNQPANSPDLNILDLGLFRSIQSLQHQLEQQSLDGLIAATEQAFWSMEAGTLNDVFLTWQSCMIEIMATDGGNAYKQPHLKKRAHERKGIMQENLQCPNEVLRRAIEFVSI